MYGKSALVSVFVLLASCHPSPHPISVQPLVPHMGTIGTGLLMNCDVENGDLVFGASATCVVDNKQRIVITDRGDESTIIDTSEGPAFPLPSIPNGGKSVAIRVPLGHSPKPLHGKHHLLIQLTGACGDEPAAGAFECHVRVP